MNKLILFFFFFLGSAYLFAGDINIKGKSVTYNVQHTAHWDKQPWNRSISDNLYRKFQTEAMKARYEGYLSKQTVNATIEASVSRKTVLNGSFALVKQGAKLVASKANVYVGGALLAYQAYEIVKGSLEGAGYKWNEVSEEFLKEWPARNCIWIRDDSDRLQYVDCYGVDSSVLSAYRKGGKSQAEAEQLMQSQMENLAGPFWEKRKKELDKKSNSKFWEYYHLDGCTFNLNGGSCSVKRGSDGRNSIYFALRMRDTEILDNNKFLQIATQSIDSNPTPFVEGTGKPEYQENIKVPAGTVVTIGPITPENGKPVQVTITFGQDSNGNTTAEVATTQRPDLTPGGSEAPNTKPDPDPKPNPDGNPDGKPDGNPDGDPSDKENRKEDKKDDKGLLCNLFPDILACSEKGDVEEQEEPFKIPHTNNETTFSPDFFLPDNGVCPAPRTATYLGITMEFKYDMICNFAQMIRFLVIGIAAVAAAFIMFSSRKD